ncbi:sulfotransferase [Maricaulis sp.]|uniref:sulfotransferase n=1 Tax=Maricaulis sp. TaxID=1486257 RepID=UPI0025C244D8|nr:sulfotransferase [Maricaulis sp.]
MEPIFVVGSGRSGTSILLNTIRKTTGLPGHGEGHFYPVVLMLNRAVNEYFARRKRQAENPNHMLHHVDAAKFRKAMMEPVRDMYQEFYGSTAFVDKTPGLDGITAIPLMQRGFPGMKVVFAKRRGIEVVRSAVKKFPHVDFEGHCQSWAKCMAAWRVSRARLQCDFVEIDQFEIAQNPEKVVRDLGVVLRLDDEQRAQMLGFFQNDRPQSSGDLNATPKSIDEVEWTAEEIATFREVCGEVMFEFGYSEGAEYFAAPTEDTADAGDDFDDESADVGAD